MAYFPDNENLWNRKKYEFLHLHCNCFVWWRRFFRPSALHAEWPSDQEQPRGPRGHCLPIRWTAAPAPGPPVTLQQCVQTGGVCPARRQKLRAALSISPGTTPSEGGYSITLGSVHPPGSETTEDEALGLRVLRDTGVTAASSGRKGMWLVVPFSQRTKAGRADVLSVSQSWLLPAFLGNFYSLLENSSTFPSRFPRTVAVMPHSPGALAGILSLTPQARPWRPIGENRTLTVESSVCPTLVSVTENVESHSQNRN